MQSGAVVDFVTDVGDAAERLLTAAGEFDATAIAVTVCHHTMLHRGILGSVAGTVARNAHRAVLLLPPALPDRSTDTGILRAEG